MAYKKWVAFGDNHGDLVCLKTQTALVSFLKDYKPDYRIHLGDAHDFRALRQGVRATESEAYEDLESDKAATRETLSLLKPNVLLLGNHDHRLWRIAREHSSGMIRSAAQHEINEFEKFCTKLRCKIIPYHYQHGFYRLGDLTFTHGYSCNESSVKQHAAYFSNGPRSGVIMGHLHRYEEANALRHGGARGWSAGCLADFERMSYAEHRMATSRWEHAWLFGVTNGKNYIVWPARKCNGDWLLPSGIESY